MYLPPSTPSDSLKSQSLESVSFVLSILFEIASQYSESSIELSIASDSSVYSNP